MQENPLCLGLILLILLCINILSWLLWYGILGNRANFPWWILIWNLISSACIIRIMYIFYRYDNDVDESGPLHNVV